MSLLVLMLHVLVMIRHFSFLPSRNGNTLSDIVAKHILKYIYPNFIKYNWNDREG